MRCDAVIFGGGVAGLWTLDRLVRQGASVVLLESRALGHGQTVASQGIIHGGLKYSLQGWLTRSAQQVRQMPQIWQQALLGRTAPNLTNTGLRSDACYLWQTDSLMSVAGMLGARLGLQVAPESIAVDERPDVLRDIRGTVARLPEQVIRPASLMADFAQQYRDRLLLIDAQQGVRFELNSPGDVAAVVLSDAASSTTFRLEPDQIIFTAGAGNARLRRQVGLAADVMQRRPLQMVLARGDLPELNGHCIDGLRTRATVTTDRDAEGRVVWQVGGQIAEDGVKLTPTQLTEHAARELRTILPDLNLSSVEWSTYTVDRAEGVTEGGVRPESVQVLCAGNVTTAWPTKLALAPILAEEVAARVRSGPHPDHRLLAALANWPRPPVARYPWDEPDCRWWQCDTPQPLTKAA